MNRKISTEIWDDPEFMELEDLEKLAVFWLITKSDPLGFCELKPKKLKRDLDFDVSVFEGASKGLERGLVETERGFWLRNFIRFQYADGMALYKSNVAKSLIGRLIQCDDEVRDLVFSEYPVLKKKYHEEIDSDEGATKPHIRGKYKYKYKLKEKESPKRKPKSFEEVVNYATSRGLPASDGQHFFDSQEAGGWTRNGEPLKDWRASFRTWQSGGHLPSQKGQQARSGQSFEPADSAKFKMVS